MNAVKGDICSSYVLQPQVKWIITESLTNDTDPLSDTDVWQTDLDITIGPCLVSDRNLAYAILFRLRGKTLFNSEVRVCSHSSYMFCCTFFQQCLVVDRDLSLGVGQCTGWSHFLILWFVWSKVPCHWNFRMIVLYFSHLISSHLSLNRECRWGTTDDFTISFLHFSLFSAALWDLANSMPVHSLVSSHLFLCLPCLLPPFTVPCKMVLARPDEWETWPYHCSF